MPQVIVVRNLTENDPSTAGNPFPSSAYLLRLVMNGNVKQTYTSYTPKYLLLKTPYRFNRDNQSLVPSSVCVRCDWSLSQDLQRRRP